MIRIIDKADREYINNLLDEMEKDKDFYFEIDVNENRKNGIIGDITIIARRIEECGF